MNEPVDASREALLRQYLTALQERGAELHRVDDLGSDEPFVFQIAGLGYVLVSISLDFPGLWRLDQTLISLVQQRASDDGVAAWFALLIARRDGRGANGYILSGFSSTPVKREIEHDGEQLLIREKRHLDSLRLILSTDKQADLLLRKRT
jgi:hypothetical protein